MYTESLPDNEITTIRRRTWGRLFGSGIEEARKAAGLSIEEAAAAAGMAASEWLAIEAGDVPGDWEQLCTMADAMNVRHEQMALCAFLCQGAWQS